MLGVCPACVSMNGAGGDWFFTNNRVFSVSFFRKRHATKLARRLRLPMAWSGENFKRRGSENDAD